MAISSPVRQSSGASGPAYASAQPRIDPVMAASSGGPSRAEMRAAWEAYKGIFQGPLTALPGQPDLNVIANRVGPEVRTGVDFLFGPVLKMEHKDKAAQDILDAAWGPDDKRMTLLSKCRINGGVFGHVFVKIVTPRNGKPMSAQNPPRLVVQNPELYSVETDPDDCDLVTCYYCTWQSADGTWHQQRTERLDPDDPDLSENNNYNDGPLSEIDADASWQITNWCKKGDAGDLDDWIQEGDPTPWGYPFAPLVDWQNYPNPNDHWGAADIDDSLVNLNRALHLVESNTNAVQYSHGHPWLFSTGADTGGITPTPGGITDLGSPDAKIQAISAAGDIAGMQAFAAQIRSDMDEGSATPGVATGRMSELPAGQLAGVTVRLLYGPRIMRTEHERRLYGAGICELDRRLLILCGQEASADEPVKLTWTDPLPQDDAAMAQMAVALQQVGLSKHTIFSLIGQDYDTEQELLKTEAQDQLTALAHGQGLPPAPAMMPGAPAAAPAQPGQPPATGNGGNMPPVNHPAAIAARVAAKAAGAAMRANGPRGAQ